jgi:flagellar hook-length control protein FliK
MNSVGDQGGLNFSAGSGAGYTLVSRSTNSDGSRATQYQSNAHSFRDVAALRERFSQVLTERLIQNVKSGNYNLRFNVHPRELGAVDIAMEVRDGRLDAQISSTNPVTRDLLSESLPRLRDALQAGGLQLSNLEVNDNARDNQKRGLMSSDDHDDSAIESNETVSNLLVEDLTLDAESVDYLA